ncbi:hypothetical protein FOPE_03246 [Fonsecaea pedrosoi]|nr:hypothetical protein FOPE_03246 [Fonsecaea pedrosoi]
MSLLRTGLPSMAKLIRWSYKQKKTWALGSERDVADFLSRFCSGADHETIVGNFSEIGTLRAEINLYHIITLEGHT